MNNNDSKDGLPALMSKLDKPINYDRFPLRDSPPQIPFYLHLAALIGTSGSGKTTKFLRMAQLYNSWGCYDKVRLYGKSCFDDPKYRLLNPGHIDPETKRVHPDAMRHPWDVKMTDEFNTKILKQFVEETNYDIAEYERDKEYIPIWVKWHKYNGDNPRSLEHLTDEEISQLRRRQFKKPRWFKMPSVWLIFDDFLGSRLIYPSRNDGPIVNMTIRSRHKSVAIMHLLHGTQDTLTPTIKSNVKYVFLNQETSKDIKKKVARTFCKGIDEDEFIHIWEYACKDKYDYLYCDLNKKEYYRNFDTRLKVQRDEPED